MERNQSQHLSVEVQLMTEPCLWRWEIRDRVRGEITLLVEAPPALANEQPHGAAEKIADRVARIQTDFGVDEKEALKRLARELGKSKSELYRELQRERARRTSPRP